MVDIYKVIKDCENGVITIEEANEKLKDTGIYIDFSKQEIDEKEYAVYYEDVTKINGYARLDTGTGTMDKVEIKDGKLVNCDCGEMPAFVVFADGAYHKVVGDKLVSSED